MFALLKKDVLEGMRSYKFLAIAIVFLFFAILNPALNKVILPGLLEEQFKGFSPEMMAEMLITTRRECVRIYLMDVFQIGTLVIVLVTGTLISSELKNHTLILPVMSGKSLGNLIFSKWCVYGAYIMICSILATIIDYLYAGILFGYDSLSIWIAIRSGAYLGVYFIFILTIVLFIGAHFKSTMITGLLSLIPAYGVHIVSQLFQISKYTPSGLVNEALAMPVYIREGAVISLMVTLGFGVVIFTLLHHRINNTSIAAR